MYASLFYGGGSVMGEARPEQSTVHLILKMRGRRCNARIGGSRNLRVPRCSVLLFVRIVAVSKRGLAVNIVMVTARDRQVAKNTVPFRIAAVNGGVELEVGIVFRIVVDEQTA